MISRAWPSSGTVSPPRADRVPLPCAPVLRPRPFDPGGNVTTTFATGDDALGLRPGPAGGRAGGDGRVRVPGRDQLRLRPDGDDADGSLDTSFDSARKATLTIGPGMADG